MHPAVARLGAITTLVKSKIFCLFSTNANFDPFRMKGVIAHFKNCQSKSKTSCRLCKQVNIYFEIDAN